MSATTRKKALLNLYQQTRRAIDQVVENDEKANLLMMLFPFRRFLWKKYRPHNSTQWRKTTRRYLNTIQKTIQEVEPAARDHLKRLLIPSVANSISVRTCRRIVKSIHDTEERENALADWCRYFLKKDFRVYSSKTLVNTNSDSVSKRFSFFKEALFHLEDANLYEEFIVLYLLKTLNCSDSDNTNFNRIDSCNIKEEEIQIPLQQVALEAGKAKYYKEKGLLALWENSLDRIRALLDEHQEPSYERDRMLLELMKYPEFVESFTLPWFLERFEDKRECLRDDNGIRTCCLTKKWEPIPVFPSRDQFYDIDLLLLMAEILFRTGDRKAGRDTVRRILGYLKSFDNDAGYLAILRRLYFLHKEIDENRAADNLLEQIRNKVEKIEAEDIKSLILLDLVRELIRHDDLETAEELSSLIPIQTDFYPIKLKIMLYKKKNISDVLEIWLTNMLNSVESPLSKSIILTRACRLIP